ncbi:hypothetical protein J7W08_07315 [Methanococcoides orientis]|uniref:hypothetical protein n=1 Tax=Methanococcoides orientis TaxID=2822137 RepID=UPI001E44B09E|nr:hypothetical protein [Methanococcoides orientis]UGV39930.1 hypothetical protein J7W08_07315 [Methanococcoides orientis]
MDLSILTEIDSSIILGIVVSIIVMSVAVFYDKYRGDQITEPNTSTSKSYEMLGQFIDLSSFKVSNPFVGSGQKIKKLINRDSNSKENETSELAVDAESNYSGIKGIFSNFRSKISSIKLSLPGKGDRDKEAIVTGMASSKNAASTEKESNIDFDVDKIVGNKKNELDFDDNLINEMATAGSLGTQIEVDEPDSDLSLNGDLSIDMDEFDFGFGEVGDEQDDSQDDEFSFEISEDEPYNDNFSFEDDDDSFIESLKNDIIIEEKKKADFMSEMKGESLDIEEIKTELEGVLENLKRYNTP